MLNRIACLLFSAFLWLDAAPTLEQPLSYTDDDLSQDLLHVRDPASHIKVFLPSIPYTYVSRLINGSLLRVSDNARGWEYMMATQVIKVDEVTYDIKLREGVRFQDGTPFDAKNVEVNFNRFIKKPFTYTDIHQRLKSIEVLSTYMVRFHLHKPYGMFVHDLARINLYSDEYLRLYGWQGAATGDNMVAPGPYGLGPFILFEGYATGRKQTPKVVLKANPYYYEKDKPYIETVSIFTELGTNEAVKKILGEEGALDISSIPFNKKVEAVLSPYSKLITMPSTHNITIYFNLMKPRGFMKDKEIRLALNRALDQENLLNFVYKNEGKIAPTAASVNYDAIKERAKTLPPHGHWLRENPKEKEAQLRQVLSGVHLHVVTQDRFMFLWKGIEYQLKNYGVSLEYTITTSEKEIYEQLLTNRQNPKEWDILTWGNDDWYGRHPWTVFFAYRTDSEWSAIDHDEQLQQSIQHLFDATHQSHGYYRAVNAIVDRVYSKAYMLFVPSPNLVYAMNKEVYFKPSSVAILPLWEAKVSKYHWSVRKGDYPKERQNPMKPIRYDKP